MMKPYYTIAKPASAELVIERSRFIAHCCTVETQDYAKDFITRIRERYWDANHNCYAYRIGFTEYPLTYYNDHGEPSGTAGKPILGAIERHDLTDVVILVTRYFGGKKLGVRGLIDAYGQVASLVLKQAGRIKKIPSFSIVLTYPYPNHPLVLHRLQQIGAVIETTEFAETITTHCTVPEEKRVDFNLLLQELSLKID